MHNWRFLLLAFVAVFQPIATFSEGEVDGRQRCDLRTASLRDPGLSFHGTHRFTKPLENRCLGQRDVRGFRRNELKEERFRSVQTPERRFDVLESRGRTSERLARSTQAENRLATENINLRRETRDAQFRSENRDQRNRIERERLSIVSDTRQIRRETSRYSDKLEDEIRNSRRSIASRTSMESRRDTERHRDNTKSQRAQEIREARTVSDRQRDDLTVPNRVGRERAQDLRRVESRVQQERNGERQILNRRSRNVEPRSSRVNRAYNVDDSRRVTQSLDRDERLSTRSRRSFDGSNLQHDSRITYQDIVTAQLNIVRDSPERIAKQAPQRRVVAERNARQLSRQRIVEDINAEWDRDTKLTRATRFEVNRVSWNQRARSAENRRNARDTRRMELNFRSSERTVENQREHRLIDRESVISARRETRDFNRASRLGMQNRAVENKREIRNIVRESREIRDEADKENNSCLLNRGELTDRRMADQRFERVSRILTANRDARNQMDIRNKERDTRVLGRERAEHSRSVDRDTRLLGRVRMTERNMRMNLVDVRSARKERSIENLRDTRENTDIQRMRVDQSNRRDIRNNERLSSSLERVTNLNTRRNVRESRDIENRASTETRAERDIRRDFRAFTLEGRQNNRNVERGQRVTRFVERDSRQSRRERSAESRRDIRQIRLPQASVTKRERAVENRREIRNIDRVTRALRSVEIVRIDAENVRDYRSKDRENSRVAERVNGLDARRSRSLRESNVETRRNSERNMETERREEESRYRSNMEFARQREFNTIKYKQTESESSSINWQYLLYTLQGLYICGILTQLMNETSGKKFRALSWYSAPQHLIKVD